MTPASNECALPSDPDSTTATPQRVRPGSTASTRIRRLPHFVHLYGSLPALRRRRGKAVDDTRGQSLREIVSGLPAMT